MLDPKVADERTRTRDYVLLLCTAAAVSTIYMLAALDIARWGERWSHDLDPALAQPEPTVENSTLTLGIASGLVISPIDPAGRPQ